MEEELDESKQPKDIKSKSSRDGGGGLISTVSM